MALNATACHSAMADQLAVVSLNIKLLHAGMYFATSIPGTINSGYTNNFMNEKEFFVHLPQVLNNKSKRGI